MLEEAVQAPGGQPGEVERGRARAADVAHLRQQPGDQLGLGRPALAVVAEPGGHQRPSQLRGARGPAAACR